MFEFIGRMLYNIEENVYRYVSIRCLFKWGRSVGSWLCAGEHKASEKFGILMLLVLYFKSLLGSFTECLCFKLYVNLFKTLLSICLWYIMVYLPVRKKRGAFESVAYMLLCICWGSRIYCGAIATVWVWMQDSKSTNMIE